MSRPMEQLYVFISEMIESPPPAPCGPEEMARQHHAYLQDLLDRGILFGSGAAKDETGKRHAGGVVILRANSFAHACTIAAQEPYVRDKQREMRVIPWQRTWFEA
ncbi:MAG: YciI family protein [Beijerinckiaceae bacterium]